MDTLPPRAPSRAKPQNPPRSDRLRTLSNVEDPQPLLTAREALERLGWNRTSLWRAERAGRICRAATVKRQPMFRAADVERLRAGEAVVVAELDDGGDAELSAIHAELDRLLERDQVDGVEPLRLMLRAHRRTLMRRTRHGAPPTPAEIDELLEAELRVDRLDELEQANARTRWA